jgi:hypothetical protein
MADFTGDDDVQELPILQLQIHMDEDGELEVSVQGINTLDPDDISDLLDAAISTVKGEL